jgi:hypothetical protein
MRNTKNYRRYREILLLNLVAFLVTACTSSPTSTSSLTAGVPTPITTDPLPNVTQFATATNPQPTAVPSTDVVATDTSQDNSNLMGINLMNIQIGERVLTATLVKNSSVDALKQALSKGPITINMRDYGSMEKVGSLGMDLPQNNEQITTEPGDIILYQGSAFVIYYAPNSWNFTRLGKIKNVSAEELKEILGDGSVTITLSLPQE